MRTSQSKWTKSTGWTPSTSKATSHDADLVFVFGGRDQLADGDLIAGIMGSHPSAMMIGCSTAGEIMGATVDDDSIVVTSVKLEHTKLRQATVSTTSFGSSREAGAALALQLPRKDLTHVMVFSDGQHVNGTDLVAGMMTALPSNVRVTGGLAGDGARFQKTLVWGSGLPSEDKIVAVGFYGDRIRVGYGSMGGWDPFGPDRLVTRSTQNVLYELEGQPALALYKKYLGDHAAGLPSSGLLFPLNVRTSDGRSFVRTLLAVDEAQQSLTFAGDIPEGAYAQLMKANFDRLVDGATGAAKTSFPAFASGSPDLAILISCVGRKLVLGQRTAEELEAVQEVLGKGTQMTGFYSYGEISPAAQNANCELHNQTMTITTLTEV